MSIIISKTEMLISSFLEGKALTINDIKQIIGATSKTTVYLYLSEVEKAGLTLSTKKDGRKIVYYLDNVVENLVVTNAMCKEDIEKFVIMDNLHRMGAYSNKTAVNSVQLRELIINGDEHLVDDDIIQLDIKQTHYYKLISTMLNEKLIIAAKKTKNKEKSFYLPCKFYEDYDDNNFLGEDLNGWSALYEMICQIPETHTYYNQLKRIEKKLSLAMGNTDYLEKRDCFITCGRSHHGSEKLNENIEKLQKYHYATRLLKIKKRNSKETEYVGVAFIIYSLDQDCAYLIGKKTKHPNSKNNNHFVDCLVKFNSDIEVQKTDYYNSFYKSEEVKKRIRNMIGASADDMEDNIEIILLKNCDEYEKELINNLNSLTNGRLINEKEFIRYNGNVIGRGNVLKLLRQLGENLIDVNDDKHIYKKNLLNSAQRTIKSYEEYFNDNK